MIHKCQLLKFTKANVTYTIQKIELYKLDLTDQSKTTNKFTNILGLKQIFRKLIDSNTTT